MCKCTSFGSQDRASGCSICFVNCIEAKLRQVSINSGFGGIHGAILTLVAKCLGSGRWIDDVRPQTDAELVDASVYAAGESKICRASCEPCSGSMKP
jgi:hypothetical protein